MIKELSTEEVKILYQNGFTPKYLTNANLKMKDSYWFVFFKEEKPIGILQLKLSRENLANYPNKKNILIMISVLEEFKRQRVGNSLILYLFNFLKKRKENHLIITAYSKEGFFLRKKIHEIAENIEIIDKEQPITF